MVSLINNKIMELIMAKLLNIIEHENKLLDKVFFHGDYLADRTASGKEECGIRLWHRVDEELMKEEVEELYHLIVTSSEMLKMLKTLVEQVKVLVSVCEDRIASLNDDEVTIGDDLKDQIAHFTSIQSNAQNALKEITFKKTFQYDGLGSTLVFAESLGFVDNSPSSNAEGWNPDEADGLEDSAIEFIESKGYNIVGYPEEDQS
jgi:hypothetical protein